MNTAFLFTSRIHRPHRRRPALFFILLTACDAFSQITQAVTPPPDGGYPGGNTAEGQSALLNLTGGTYNTAVGWFSIGSNTNSQFNTGLGAGTLFANTGDNNTAVGAGALLNNSTGGHNTANGAFALFTNSEGADNTAIGDGALFANTADGNTAVGRSALLANTTANSNIAVGDSALLNNTTGSNNTAIGAGAGENLTIGDSNIDIANPGVAGESATIRIGSGNQTSTFIAGINGTAVTGTGVVVSASGQLGVATSSARFKYEIKPMDKTSEALFALKPVSFRYKKEIDPEGTWQFGLVAEEVQNVNPALVVRDTEGKPYTVRYDAVNAMLLNEFLKEHHKVEQLKQDFESKMAEQQKQIEALTAGLEKVSAQLAANKPTPQVVNNP